MKKILLNKIVNNLNGKKIEQLSFNNKLLIKKIFPNIDKNSLIKCDLYEGKKINISITINNVTKRITFMSKQSSVIFNGDMKEVVSFLFAIGASYEIIKIILDYLSLDKINITDENGLFLKENVNDEIALVNKEFSDSNKMMKLLEYFLLKEKNGLEVDYFLFGNEKNLEAISKELIVYNIINSKINSNYLKLGPFNLMANSRFRDYKCILKINLYKYKKIIEKTRLLNNT